MSKNNGKEEESVEGREGRWEKRGGREKGGGGFVHFSPAVCIRPSHGFRMARVFTNDKRCIAGGQYRLLYAYFTSTLRLLYVSLKTPLRLFLRASARILDRMIHLFSTPDSLCQILQILPICTPLAHPREHTIQPIDQYTR